MLGWRDVSSAGVCGSEGLEFCLESGVPPGGPCFLFSVWRAAFCLESGVGPEGRVLVSP